MGNIKFLNGEEQTAELQEKAEVRLDEPPAADRKEEQAAHVLFEDILTIRSASSCGMIPCLASIFA